jgi:biotin synthase-related radical SAM superfamily protein
MTRLLTLIEDMARERVLPEGLRLYLFGSAIQTSSTPTDVDLLLIYANGFLDDAHTVAESIRSTPAVPPYDVLVASETEAAQLNLVAKQAAILIWPLA